MTNRAERWRIISSAVAAFTASGEDAWRTRVQKLLFFAEEWGDLATKPYEFVIHRFGPYSFDLDRDIAEMQGFGVLERKSVYRLGASYSTSGETTFLHNFKPFADWLGNKTVQELEVLATVEFVQNRSREPVTDEVVRLKPHVSREAVENAIRELESMRPKLGASTSRPS